MARARGLARLRAHYGGTPAEAGPHTAQHTPALHRHLITTTACTVQLETKVAEDYDHGEGLQEPSCLLALLHLEGWWVFHF